MHTIVKCNVKEIQCHLLPQGGQHRQFVRQMGESSIFTTHGIIIEYLTTVPLILMNAA